MSQVCDEKERIQVVMPKTKIPNWFDCVGSEDIPIFWVRRKFPMVALALVFGESQQNNEIPKDTFISDFFPGLMSDMSHIVGLHIFIDGQEVCRKNYHYCSVGENHVLMCDLRTLFINNEEWQGLDTYVGDDWKVVQVQCESSLTLKCWGVHVFKQKTDNDDIDISFKLPSLKFHGGDYVPLPMSASGLVPKRSPQMSGQRMRHVSENMNPREIFGEYLPLLELEETPSFTKALLRSWRIAQVEINGEASAIAFGGSLKQEHEESGWDVVRVVELMKDNIPKHIVDTYGFNNNDIQSAQRIVEQVLRARVEFMREKGNERLDIDMPIILEACHFGEAQSRRYWGKLQIKHEDPKFKAVLNKTSQLAWKALNTKEVSNDRMNIVLLKCQRPSTEEASTSSSSYKEESFEEEEYYDPVLEELMSMIEEDAMSFNKSYGILKASIVLTHELVSDKYLVETLFLRGQENLAQGNTGLGNLEMGLLGLGMLGSGISGLGRMGSNFKNTHYGKLRAEDDDSQSTTQKQKEPRRRHDVQQTVYSQNRTQHELRVEDDNTPKRKESTVMHVVQQTVHNQNQMQHELRDPQTIIHSKSKRGWITDFMRWILCCCTPK